MDNNKKDSNLTLAQRLKKLFVNEKPESQPLQTAKTVAPAAHAAGDMAFKAGAVVSFITPIGAYAGNTTRESERTRAEQAFRHMDSSQNTTIN